MPAFGLVIAIWTLELVSNLKNGQGWVSIAHLVVIAALWIAFTGTTQQVDPPLYASWQPIRVMDCAIKLRG